MVIVMLLMPTSSPGCKSVMVVLYPFASHQRIYIRMSIDAQSCASVPPAPEFIFNTASMESSSWRSMFFSSRSSMHFIALA